MVIAEDNTNNAFLQPGRVATWKSHKTHRVVQGDLSLVFVNFYLRSRLNP